MIEYKISIFQIIGIFGFGFFFGILETITNAFYLLTKNYDLPRRQHSKELPDIATDTQVFHKVIQMLFLGIFLFIVACISVIVSPQLFVVGAAGIFFNGLIDYSKFRKRNMLILWCFFAIVASVFSLISHI
jgi:hypothetical protein